MRLDFEENHGDEVDELEIEEEEEEANDNDDEHFFSIKGNYQPLETKLNKDLLTFSMKDTVDVDPRERQVTDIRTGTEHKSQSRRIKNRNFNVTFLKEVVTSNPGNLRTPP